MLCVEYVVCYNPSFLSRFGDCAMCVEVCIVCYCLGSWGIVACYGVGDGRNLVGWWMIEDTICPGDAERRCEEARL